MALIYFVQLPYAEYIKLMYDSLRSPSLNVYDNKLVLESAIFNCKLVKEFGTFVSRVNCILNESRSAIKFLSNVVSVLPISIDLSTKLSILYTGKAETFPLFTPLSSPQPAIPAIIAMTISRITKYANGFALFLYETLKKIFIIISFDYFKNTDFQSVFTMENYGENQMELSTI